MSGADLEYQAMLARAGVTQADKLDGARLEQVGDKRQADGSWGSGGGGGGGVSLPAGGTAGQLLKKNSGVTGDASWANKALDSAHADAADTATSATQATKLATPRTINGVAFDGTANISIPANVDLSGYMLKASPLTQFSQIADVTPTDGQVLEYDDTTSTYIPVARLDGAATIDGGGRLNAGAWPKYMMVGATVNEGEQAPADLPLGGFVFERPTPPSLVPLMVGKGFANTPAAATLSVAVNQTLNVGDWVEISILSSTESGGTLPNLLNTLLPATGSWTTTVNTSNVAYQTGTVQVNKVIAKVTTAIPSGTNINLTLDQSRGHRGMIIVKMPNLISTNPFDKGAINSGSSQASTTALTVGPTGATVQDDELAIYTFVHAASLTETRTIGGNNGWIVLDSIKSDSAANSRQMAVLYKVQSAIGTITGSVQVTASDGATGAWAGTLATYKAA